MRVKAKSNFTGSSGQTARKAPVISSATRKDGVRLWVNPIHRPIWDGAWNDEMSTLADDEKLKPFYLFMTSNYRIQKSFSPYDGRQREIWERIESRSK